MLELFFNNVSKRDVSEAQSIMDTVHVSDHPSGWSLGYLTALQGMVQALRSDGKISPLLHRLVAGDGGSVKLLKRCFASRATSFLSSDFDKGYFAAWTLYMESLIVLQKRDS